KDLINTFDFSVIGKITVHLNSDEFENIEQLLDESVAFNTIILDGKNNLMFSAKEDTLFDEYSDLKDNQKSFEKFLEENKYSYSLIRGTGDNKFITYVPSYKLFFMISKASYIWLGMAILLVIILLKSFKLLFQNYEAQVDDVVESLTSININTINERIPLENKEGEFLLISQTTNAMLDNMNKYIEEILVLELRQKEAELSALQAQINPHFMYNTLEYIRMNVLSEGLKDLSQVVFTFASLLRNNISSVKTIPLQKEIDFCEKYVFLYQIRHPEHIAYSFNIAREVQNKIVPRFILQPIVENYLIHGLDYDRNDNAISVEAYKEADLFVINIIDNGKGMSDEDLEKLQASILSGDQQLHKDSIGILNVSERLKYFYDGQATLSVFKNETGGITATITVKED
ncbi:MAG TPA: sensor histidine kinase, partial [Erysipelothrix sp.]|nr:sensor histidine kinase [Erysipelothrix sp.]